MVYKKKNSDFIVRKHENYYFYIKYQFIFNLLIFLTDFETHINLDNY